MKPGTEKLFEATNGALLRVWDALMRVQVDSSFPLELPIFFLAPPWHRARRVADLGCGNGHYLSRLRETFPEKTYTGVDKNRDFIKLACRTAGPRTKFQDKDIFSFTGHYDFVVMRAVVQHLPNLEELFAKLRALLRPGGCVLISDADDHNVEFWPPVPEYADMLEHLNAIQRKDKRVASAMTAVAETAPKFGFRVTQDRRFRIPSTTPGNLARLTRQFNLTVELFERTGAVDVDYKKVRNALRGWSNLPRRFAEDAMRILVLELAPPNGVENAG